MRVAINGFGRIGRLTLRCLLKMDNVEVVALNDLGNPEALAHLFRYDSAQGKFGGEVTSDDSSISIDGQNIRIFSEKDPENLPWGSNNVDVVVECTGKFRDSEGAGKHIKAGAKRVVISAPARGENVKTIVLGINEDQIGAQDKLISNASCTTNCLAPVAYLLHQHFGIDKGFINTVHAYTGDQNLQDGPHKDLRRARAAALNIVPTTTGAAKTVEIVIPELKGKLDGLATRVPTIAGSLTDFTVILNRDVTIKEVNAVMKEAAENRFQGLLQYNEDPIVSTDIIGNTHSSIFDAPLTQTNGNLVKVIMWYDNEMGYSSRTADLVRYMAGNKA